MKKLQWIADDHSKAVEISDTFWNDLSTKAYPLSKGTMTVPISLEPFVISKEKNEALQKNICLVIAAVKKLTEEYFKNEELQTLVSVDHLERELIKHSENMPFAGVVRVDLFYGATPKIVEINADFPDGLFMHDVSSEHIQKINDEELLLSSNADSFVQLLRAYNVLDTDHIFIGHDKGRVFLDEFEVTKLKLRSLGFEHVVVGVFEDLTFTDNAFYYNGEKIDVMRRGSELSKLRKIPHLLENIIAAENNNTLKVINNFKMRLLGHKSLLAILHNAQYAHLFTEEELRAIQSLVPVTRKLEEVVVDEILLNKDQWVLKPSDLAEGEGVTIGTAVTDEEWSERLHKASLNKEKWILQEKVTIPESTFHLVENGAVSVSVAYHDFCPHLFLLNDTITFGNVLVRFSSSEILNIMKGGGLTYLFEEKEQRMLK